MNITFGIAIGAVIAAIMNISANAIAKRKADSVKKEESLKVLFGELLHILSHYKFSNIPLSLVDGDDRDVFEIKKRMKFSKYGEFKAVENVESFSFLSPVHVRNIYQLSLRIRNTEILIDDYLNSEHLDRDLVSSHEEIHFIREIDSRMKFIYESANMILDYIAEQHPKYKTLIEDTISIEQPDYSI